MLSTDLTSIACPSSCPSQKRAGHRCPRQGGGLPLIEGSELMEPPGEVSPYRGGEQTSGWLSNPNPQGPSVSDRGFEPGLTYPKAGAPTIIQGMVGPGHASEWPQLVTAVQKPGCCSPRVAMSWVGALLCVGLGP